MNRIAKLLVIGLIATSCASTKDKDVKNPFDALTLKETLQEGKTSQVEIVQAFGAPDITTEDSGKQDVGFIANIRVKQNRVGLGLEL